MAKSLSQLMTQIEKLKKEAASLQSGVIDRIRKEIAKHGLTAEHLFGAGTSTAVREKRQAATSATAKPGAKFADQQGNSWSGFGPKPAWLRAAIDAGRSIQDFMTGSAPAATATPAKARKAAGKSASKSATKAPKFADGSGNTWGGMGKRPDWLRTALDSGKSLDDFLIDKPKAAAKSAKSANAVKAVKAVKVAAKAKPASKTAAAKKATAPAKRAAKTPAKAPAKAAAKAPAKAAAKPAAKKAKTAVKSSKAAGAVAPEAASSAQPSA